MEIPRLEVKSELQLPAYTTATATQDPSSVCDPHHSSGQHRILNLRSEARDRTWVLMVPSRGPQPAEPRREPQPWLLGVSVHVWSMTQSFSVSPAGTSGRGLWWGPCVPSPGQWECGGSWSPEERLPRAESPGGREVLTPLPLAPGQQRPRGQACGPFPVSQT